MERKGFCRCVDVWVVGSVVLATLRWFAGLVAGLDAGFDYGAESRIPGKKQTLFNLPTLPAARNNGKCAGSTYAIAPIEPLEHLA
jgi:hypothetical protein